MGSSAKLQVRFADSLEEKKVKRATANARNLLQPEIRPHEHLPAGFMSFPSPGEVNLYSFSWVSSTMPADTSSCHVVRAASQPQGGKGFHRQGRPTASVVWSCILLRQPARLRPSTMSTQTLRACRCTP